MIDLEDGTFLRGGSIEQATDGRTAHEAAGLVVRLANGALRVSKADFEPLTISNVVRRFYTDDNGVKHKDLGLIASSIQLKFRVNAALTDASATQDAAQPPGLAERLFAEANCDSKVRELLLVMAGEGADLWYRAYEIIKADVGFDGIYEMMGCAQAELQQFAWTVNRPRHQRFGEEPPDGPMTESEVQKFGQRMAEAWLDRV